MPPSITAATGLDAFVHAVEAITGRRRNDAVAAPASRAIRLVLDHLPAAVSDGTDLEVRAAMQRAALFAGLAIDEGGTGIAHSIGHALGTLAHVPHGAAVAAGLGAAIEWNVDGAAEAFAPVADAAGVSVTAIGATLRDLFAACNFASVVAGIGPLPVEPDALADTMIAVENRPMYDNNCRRPGDADRRQLAATTLTLWDELVEAGSK